MSYLQGTLNKASRKMIFYQGAIYPEYANSPLYPIGYKFYGEIGTGMISAGMGGGEMGSLSVGSSVMPQIVWILDSNFNRTNKFFLRNDVTVMPVAALTRKKSGNQSAFSGFYNLNIDTDWPVEFAYLNPKSLREVCGNQPLGTSTIVCLWDCSKSRNAGKDCCVKRRTRSQEIANWNNCKANWQASQTAAGEELVQIDTPGGGTGGVGQIDTPGGGTGGVGQTDTSGGGTGAQPDAGSGPQAREPQKTNIWIWVGSIAAFLILVLIIVLLLNRK